MILQSHSWAFIYPGKTIIPKDICTPVLTAALLTVARTWKETKCLLSEECIKKWYIYTLEYYSAMKRDEIMPFVATRMVLEIVILSEVRQTRTHITWYHLYAESKKEMNLFTKQKQTHRLRELMVMRLVGKGWMGGIAGEFGDWCVFTAIFGVNGQQGPAV